MYNSISNLITSLKSATRAHKKSCVVYDSKMTRQVLDMFYKEGFLLGYTKRFNGRGLVVWLRYSPLRLNPLGDLKQVSIPSKKVYLTYKQLMWRYKHSSFVLVSTSRVGLVKHTDLAVANIRSGGEIVLTIGSTKNT